jgi:hypothetical protein
MGATIGAMITMYAAVANRVAEMGHFAPSVSEKEHFGVFSRVSVVASPVV